MTEPIGCFIGRLPQPKQNAEVTYSKHIARIFQKHCVECHRRGEIAPFELTDYDEIVGWAETIAEVIEDGRMPPWHADPAHGEFKNARLMSDEEKKLVQRWVDDGAPRGDPKDLPEPRTFLTGWRLPRDPDRVIAMRDRAFQVPAEGVVEYQYFVVDPGFEKDTWVSAAEIVPGNRSVVHHTIVFVRPPNPNQKRGFGLLNAYVPGQEALVLPKGYARRIPAGSKLVFQMHYTPNGSPQQDITRIGLILADEQDVRDEVLTLVAINRKFEIPPEADDYLVRAKLRWLPKNGRIISLSPHMHLRGKSFRFVARRGTKEEILLDVPRYDFNWQHGYMLATPLPLADVDGVECYARYDNSEGNLVNPDPTASVRWGDQSWQEMMIGFFDVAIPKDAVPARTGATDESKAASREKSARATAQKFMKRFDKNGDARVQRNEVPAALRSFAFGRFDANRDGVLTIDEVVEASLKSNSRRQRSNALRRGAEPDR
ncbi:MAG: hypothetical protein MI757_10325 [Pirellulales bacterium]|nr:hypothetical protein [Pirellulales bacterium]